MFCPKCGSLLIPKIVNHVAVSECSCGYSSQGNDLNFSEKQKDTTNVDIVESDVSTNPITDAKCDKCGHDKAEYWLIQTRAGDESETQFFKCCKCHHQWREY